MQKVVLMQFWHFSVWELWIKIVVFLYFIRHPLPPLPCTHTCTQVFKSGTNVSIEKKNLLKTSSWRDIGFFVNFFICVQWGHNFSSMSLWLACISKAMARLELEIMSAEPQLCISNAASASPKVGAFKMMAQSLKSEMLWKRKTQSFWKNLDRTLGQMAVGERWKAVPCANKMHSIQFTLVMEHIALNFLTVLSHKKCVTRCLCCCSSLHSKKATTFVPSTTHRSRKPLKGA